MAESSLLSATSGRERWRRGLFLLVLVVPLLVVYDIYFQWQMPVLGCAVDASTGTVQIIETDSLCNYAGLWPGDVILRVEGVPFQEWSPPLPENYQAEILRGDQLLDVELPYAPLIRSNLEVWIAAAWVALTFWATGSLLLWRRSRQPEARLFFLLVQCIAVALLFSMAHPQDWSRPPWMEVLRTVSFQTAGALWVHYSLTFPVRLGDSRRRRIWWLWLYSLMAVAIVCELVPLLGLRYLGFIYNGFELIGALAVMVYVYRFLATPDGRRRLRLVVLGTLAAVIFPALLFSLPPLLGFSGGVPLWVVTPFIVLAPLSYLYAIARHHLFGIDRLLNQALVYAILSLGILALYFALFVLLYRFRPDDLLAQVLIAAGLTLLVGLAFDWSRIQVQHWVARVFYGGWYDYPGVVGTVSDALARSLDREHLRAVLTAQVPELMRLQGGALLMGPEEYPPDFIPSALRFSLSFRGEVRAVWVLGSRRDEDDFHAADRRILRTLARQAEIALSNVLLVDMLRRQLAAVREMQHRLLRSREEERTRLARDLHDGPIQLLIGLNLQLGLLRNTESDAVQIELVAMRSEIRSLMADLRQVCAELRPPMLDALGLGAALRSLAGEWSEQHAIPVDVVSPPDADLQSLPGDVAVNLYRIAQETLSNVAHHAAAHSVAVRLEAASAEGASAEGASAEVASAEGASAEGVPALLLSICDDGQGFAVPDSFDGLVERGHFGLTGMQERARLIGGHLSISSAPGEGTTLRVFWSPSPLPAS